MLILSEGDDDVNDVSDNCDDTGSCLVHMQHSFDCSPLRERDDNLLRAEKVCHSTVQTDLDALLLLEQDVGSYILVTRAVETDSIQRNALVQIEQTVDSKHLL